MAFATQDMNLPSANGNGDELDVSLLDECTVYLSGTFSATVQVQISPDASGSVWLDEGAALTDEGTLKLSKRARRVRAVVSSYSSGDPVASLLHGTP